MMETILAKEKAHCQDPSTPIQNKKGRYNPFYLNNGKQVEWTGSDFEWHHVGLPVNGVSLIVNPPTD